MKKQAKEILEVVKQLYEDYPESDNEGIEDMRVLIFEKKLEKILGREKYQGVFVRELEEGKLSLVCASSHLTCKKVAANSVEIYIEPYKQAT